MEIKWWCKTCGETFERMRFKCPKCGDGVYQYNAERDAERLALAQSGEVASEAREREKGEEKRKLGLFIGGILVAIVLVSALVFVFAGSPSPSSKPLTVAVENATNVEVSVRFLVDGVHQGYNYVGSGETEYFSFEDFNRTVPHDVTVISSGLYADHVVPVPAGKSLHVTIHQDQDLTYFFY